MEKESDKKYPDFETCLFTGEPIITAEHIYGTGNVCICCNLEEKNKDFKENNLLNNFCSVKCFENYYKI